MKDFAKHIPITSLCFIAAIGIGTPAESVRAQAERPPDEAKKVAAQEKAAERAKLSEKFYSSLDPLEMTLTTNIKRIRNDKADKAPWRPATLTFTDATGKQHAIPMRIRTRGIWRLKNCEFPPLRLNFRNEETKGTILEGVDKPKLVNYCQDRPQFKELIMQEMQLYRIYNLLTPVSHRARLVKVNYVDSASGKVHTSQMAMFVEEPEVMAARLGGPLVEEKGATPDHLVASQDVLAGVFQYFIGNTDWSTFALHNVELIRQPDGSYLPVPYDFDFSGAVNAPYATVDPKLSVQRVRDRLYRGFCYPEEEYTKAFTLFNEKKDAIYALYRDPIGNLMDKRTVEETLKYFDEFYKTINDSRRARREIIENCTKIQ